MALSDRRADRRERFVTAAIDLFGTAGYAHTPVEAICVASKLGRGQFYAVFDQREDLLLASYDRIQDEAEAAVRTAAADLGTESTGRDFIARLFGAYLMSIAADPARARVAYVEIVGVSDRVEAHRRERRAQWGPILEDLVRRTHGAEVELPGGPGMTATALIGAINALGHEWSLSKPRPPLSDLVDVVQSLVMGIGWRTATTASD